MLLILYPTTKNKLTFKGECYDRMPFSCAVVNVLHEVAGGRVQKSALDGSPQ